jgi:hypothetical protein
MKNTKGNHFFKSVGVLSLAVLVLLVAAPNAKADTIDLGAPYAALPFFTANDLGNNDRSVILDAFNNLTISSVGIFLDPLTSAPFTLGVAIYSSSSLVRGPLLASSTQVFGADVGPAFYDIPIDFTFVAGNSYEIALFALPSPPGFGTGLYTMELQHFDQGYCTAHAISCPPYDVASALTITEGGACGGGHGGATDCVGADTSGNDNFPHLQLITNPVPEPTSLSLFGAGLVGLWLLRRRQQRRAGRS